LKVKIDVDTRDEIGLLAQAIGRMQTSLQIAMRRLRKKR
jgi:HAMP domain-containing protein